MNWTNRILGIVCCLAVPASGRAVAQPATPTVGRPPELVVAVAVDGQTLEIRRFVERTVTRTTTATYLPASGSGQRRARPATAKEIVPLAETQITRVDAAQFTAQRVGGRTVPSAELMKELRLPRLCSS